MRHNALGLAVLASLVVSGINRSDDKPPAIKVSQNAIRYHATLDGKPVSWFGVDGAMYQYEISLNMKLPQAGELKNSLLAALAQNKQHRDKIVFSPFTPDTRDKPPQPIEVGIGRNVPLEIVQAVLGEISKLPDRQLAFSVMNEDGQGIETRQLFIGGTLKRGKAATPEKLKSLLDPKLTHKEFLDLIQKDDKLKPDVKAQPEQKEKAQPEKKEQEQDLADQNERRAASKLKQAKTFSEDGKQEDAREYCEEIIKKFPKTKAATEAAELLKKLKK